MKYILYRTNGTSEVIEKDGTIEIDEIYKLLDCNYIDFIEKDNFLVAVDDEGLCTMKPRNPFFKPPYAGYYAGDMLLGMRGDNADFMGLSEEEFLTMKLPELIGYKADTFKKDKIITLYTISDGFGGSVEYKLKCTGELYKETMPVFKDAKKGAKKKFTLKKIDDIETLVFDEPTYFSVDSVRCSQIRLNGLLNFTDVDLQELDKFRKFIESKNLNNHFNAYDKIFVVDKKDGELVPVYPDFPTFSSLVEKERKQYEAKCEKENPDLA